MPSDALVLVEQYAYELGQTYDSYLSTEPDREYFFSPARRGAVGFKRWGRYAYIVGGLLASPGDQDELLQTFLEFAAAQRLHVSFYNLGCNELEPFRRQGCEISKCGEEPMIKLANTSWNGKDYQWLRRQENFCTRQGVVLRELAHDSCDPEYRDRIVPVLEEISRIHVAGTLHAQELEFFEGRFRPLALGRRRLFVAERNSRIEAFLVCNPCLAGSMWAIEIYRRHPDATRGVIPFAMLKIMRQLKSEGVAYVSLSQIPCLRTGLPMQGDSRLLRYVTRIWWYGFGWIFDMRGIYHFKSRFRPDYRELYVAASPKITLLSLLGFAATWKLLVFNPFRLAVHGLRKVRKSGDRAKLARPEFRAERLVRELRGGSDASGNHPTSQAAAPAELANNGSASAEAADVKTVRA